MLDVRRLRVLREVAALGSFSAAADALSYTQSAISQQIATLEREAGTVLVERSSRGVRLTDAGRGLLVHTEAILSRLADAEAELEAIAGVRSGRLRMTTFTTAGATIAPRAIVAFRAEHPGVELSLEPAEWPESLERLRTGEVDIALTITAPFQSGLGDDVDLVHLLDEPMYVVLAADHRLAGETAIRLEDLAEEEWILGHTNSGCPDSRIFVRACQGAGYDPRVSFNSEDYLAIQGFVAAGFGVSMIPEMALIAVREDVVVRAVDGVVPQRRVWAATLKGSWQSPARAAMLETLQTVSAEFTTRRGTLRLVA